MIKIVIIGAGFAGISVLLGLGKSKRELQISVVDKKTTSDFLPALPDIIGRGINPEYLRFRITDLQEKLSFRFINQEVVAVDLNKRQVLIGNQTLEYDFLVIASGSETNFYGNDDLEKCSFKLDCVDDAKIIKEALETGNHNYYLICGGGYTGIEIATNIRRYFNNKSLAKKVVIVERAGSLLGPLPQWMKDYVVANLKELDIGVLTNAVIEKREENRIFLSNKMVFDNAMLIWSAGVKTANFMQGSNLDKTSQGRLRVDEYLRVNDNCYAIGDAAAVLHQDKILRMGVQFSVIQGITAAVNILNAIRGQALKKYSPLDLGYIMPMANNRSCGSVLGFDIKGLIPTLAHFLMCAYRLRGFKNKLGLIMNLLKGGLR